MEIFFDSDRLSILELHSRQVPVHVASGNCDRPMEQYLAHRDYSRSMFAIVPNA